MYLDTSTLKKSGFRHINFENFGEISKSHLFVLQVDSSKPELVHLLRFFFFFFKSFIYLVYQSLASLG